MFSFGILRCILFLSTRNLLKSLYSTLLLFSFFFFSFLLFFPSSISSSFPRNLLNPLYMSMSRPVPFGPHLKIKGKILNIWGLMYALTTFTVALGTYVILCVVFLFRTYTFLFLVSVCLDLKGKCIF